jgi:hypothetical protein
MGLIVSKISGGQNRDNTQQNLEFCRHGVPHALVCLEKIIVKQNVRIKIRMQILGVSPF